MLKTVRPGVAASLCGIAMLLGASITAVILPNDTPIAHSSASAPKPQPYFIAGDKPSFDLPVNPLSRVAPGVSVAPSTIPKYVFKSGEERMKHTSHIDVLFAYSPQALSEAGSAEELSSRAFAAVDAINYAAERSDAPFVVQIAAIVPTKTNDPATLNTALRQLTEPNDDEYRDVSEAREQYGADLVQLFTNVKETCGLGSFGPAAERLFSVISGPCSKQPIVSAHEFGHNLGLNHDRYETKSPGSPGSNFGYVDTEGGFTTLMSYDTQCVSNNVQCEHLMQFSNPDQTYKGRPLGVPAGHRGSADAVSTLRVTAPMVASAMKNAGYPTVRGVSPTAGSSNIDSTTKPSVYFNENVENVTEDTFTMYDLTAKRTVPGSVSYLPKAHQATFTPNEELESEHDYRMTLSSGIVNSSDYPLPSFSWSFKAASKPKVTNFSPRDGSVDSPANVNPVIRYSESIRMIDEMPYLLDPNGKRVPVKYTQNDANFIHILDPVDRLERGVKYTVVIPAGLRNMLGSEVEPSSYSFTTK